MKKKPLKSRYRVEIADRQTRLAIDPARLRQAVTEVLTGEGFKSAHISLAIVDDVEMHALNNKFLAHDEPTDVLSFVLEESDGRVEGEIIASTDTAARQGARVGMETADELLLYLVHGTLHLCGYDDTTDETEEVMRERERHYLAKLGIKHLWPD